MDTSNPFSSFFSNDSNGDDRNGDDDRKMNENILMAFKQIHINIIEPEGKWCFPPLYKPGANGLLFHQIGFDGENVIAVHGLSGMKLQTSPTEVTMNTRSVSIQHQAMIQARGLFRSKYDDNYRELGSNLPRVKEPMLGYPINEAATCQVPLLFPVAVEVKLDGVRCMFEITDGQVTARSRGGKYYNQYDHICKFLSELFAYFPNDTMLDAEMYKHGMKREQISGVTRTIAEEMEEGKQMIAYIFDAKFADDIDYESRKKRIRETVDIFLSDKELTMKDVPISLVPYNLAYSWEEIYSFDDWAVESGYEGTMVKRILKSVEENSYGR
jgi:ATP-dependent DNA ligase